MLIPELNYNQDFRNERIKEKIFNAEKEKILKLNNKNSVIEFGFYINRK